MEPPTPSQKSFPQVSFIICKHRKNRPKISPSVCEQRCGRTKDCREYFNYIQPAMFGGCEKRAAEKREKTLDKLKGKGQKAKIKDQK
jgi:hypothetical protein